MVRPILKKLALAATVLAPSWAPAANASAASASDTPADYGSIRFRRETIDGVGIHEVRALTMRFLRAHLH
jgi:hypothetical protein